MICNMRPLIGVTTSELRPSAAGDDAPPRRARAPRDGAGDDLSAHARRGRRDPRRAAADRHRPPRAAARSPRRHLPLRRPRPRPGGLRRARPSRRARPDRAEPRRVRAEPRPARRSPRGLPILAICRGAQALNVACGGTLHQHIAGPPPDRRRRREATHEVEIEPRSRLHRIIAHAHARRELLPPPGGRPGRRRPAGRRPRASDGTIEGDRGRAASSSASSGTPRRCTRTCRCSRRWLGRLPVPNCASPRDTLGGRARPPPAWRRQALRRADRRRPPRPRGARRHLRRPARPQRRRQVDDDAPAHGAGDPGRGRDRDPRPPGARASRRPRARCAASCRSSTTST